MNISRERLLPGFHALSGRIGIYGGTFDPVHMGHIETARMAMESASLDRVIFVPNRKNPLKTSAPVAEDNERLEMLLLSAEAHPHFLVSDIELRRDGPSYTVDTLKEIRSELPEETDLLFLAGSDSLISFPSWHCVESVFDFAEVLIFSRREFPFERLEELRGKLSDKSLARIETGFLHIPYIDISSTGLRAAVASAPPWPEALPLSVLEYIRYNGLYRERCR